MSRKHIISDDYYHLEWYWKKALVVPLISLMAKIAYVTWPSKVQKISGHEWKMLLLKQLFIRLQSSAVYLWWHPSFDFLPFPFYVSVKWSLIWTDLHTFWQSSYSVVLTLCRLKCLKLFLCDTCEVVSKKGSFKNRQQLHRYKYFFFLLQGFWNLMELFRTSVW